MSRTKQCIGAIDCNEPVERTKDGKPRPRCEKHRKEHAQGLLASMARIDPDIAASLGLAVEG